MQSRGGRGTVVSMENELPRKELVKQEENPHVPSRFSNRRHARDRVRERVWFSDDSHYSFDMRYFRAILLAILLLATCCVAYNYNHNGYNPDRVLLSGIQTLTFSPSKYTTGRRSR